MKYIKCLLETLKKQEELHHKDIYNYVIPSSWNTYGYKTAHVLKTKEIIVNPYCFFHYTLRAMFENNEGQSNKIKTCKDKNWIQNTSIYALNIRAHSAWDHDRDEHIMQENLYHMQDNGTFLKSMILLPFLKRMGIHTILLSSVSKLGNTSSHHKYPVKEAVYDFQSIDENLADTLLDMDPKEQFAAFVEACHYMGIRVILEYCPGKLARENAYIKNHPEWFYWIEKDYLRDYHSPECIALTKNVIPYTYTLKDFYQSDDVKQHISKFRKYPDTSNYATLKEIEDAWDVTIAPFIVDQINANIPCDKDTTIFRLYEKPSSHISKHIATDVPYMSEDTIRNDLHPGKLPIEELWNMLCENVTWMKDNFHIDGIFLQKPYLLSEKLQKQICKEAKRNNKNFVMIVEENTIENSSLWLEKGYDAISGNSGYENSDIWNRSFQTFAYRLKNNPCPVFAAGEYADSRRVCCMDGGKRLTILLHVMNRFLPNAIPFMLNGAECMETQPLQLSEYGDQKYLYTVSKDDPRYLKQAYLDSYAFDYRNKDLNALASILEPAEKLRQKYVWNCSLDQCIPVWFASPKDEALGFTYIKEDSALMVVASTNIHDASTLQIHTENLFTELPFSLDYVHQILSTEDPYTHDVTLDSFRNIPLEFQPGEVKFILFQGKTEKTK